MSVFLIAMAGASPAVAQNPPRGAVRADARLAQTVVRPGDVLTIAVTLTHASGFHTWPHEPVVPEEFEGVNPIPTEIELADVPPGTELVEVVWPEPQPVTVHYGGEPTALLSYTGSALISVRLRVPPDTPEGRGTVVLTVRFQACDARLCYPPQRVETAVQFRVERAGPARPAACCRRGPAPAFEHASGVAGSLLRGTSTLPDWEQRRTSSS